MRKVTSFLTAVACVLLATATAHAQAPRTLSYQGILTDAAGSPVSGTHLLTVRLYDAATGGHVLHTEAFTSTLNAGLFNVVLGQQAALEASATNGSPLWLGVAVDEGRELSPRTAFASVPYALHADAAASLVPGASGAVTGINGRTGDLEIKAGDGVLLEQTNNTITISAVNQSILHGSTPTQTFVNQAAGTTDQVLVNGGTAALTGNITLSLPQSIGTSSSPTFTGLKLTGLNSTGVVHNSSTGTLSTSLIVDADVSSSAAISDSKLATISTSGKVSNSATTATSTNTANTIVSRDASGSFSATTVQANLTGNVTGNVTGNLTGNVTGNLTGNVTGNVAGNLTGNVTGNVAGNVTGNLTGNVTGNVAGNLTGNVTGNVAGNVTGNLTGNVSGNVTGNLTGNVTGNVTGNLTGNVTGNVSGTSSNVTGVINEAHGGTNRSTYTKGDLLYASAANTLSALAAGTTGTVLTQSASGVPAWTALPVVAPVSASYLVLSNDATLTNERALGVGAGLSLNDGGANGNAILANTGVLSVAGTINQVSVTASTGNVTFSLPQDIHTAASPSFAGLTLSSLSGSSTAANVVVSNGGQLQTRTVASFNDTYWARGGNSGTTPGTDYVGTSDNTSLDLRTNSATALRLNTNGSLQRDGSGDARGDNSNDLQRTRFASDEVASGDHSTISGGDGNTASGIYSTVGGGQYNISNFDYTTVGGGYQNQSTNFYSTIGGGFMNTSANYFSFVGGGQSNGASGYSSAIAGGYNNHATSDYTFVGGGYNNFVTVNYSSIGGGYSNHAFADYVSIGGGYNNETDNSYCVIGGGNSNVATGLMSTISGGNSNQANGDYSYVAGGSSNNASGYGSSIIGIASITSPTASYSHVSGLAGYATNYGQHVQSSGAFFAIGDAQSSVFVARGTTSGGGSTNLTLDGGSSEITIPMSTTMAFHMLIAARDASGNSATFTIEGNAANNGGVVSISGVTTNTYANGLTTGSVNIGSTGSTLNITVTDSNPAGNTRWVARVTSAEVTF